MMVEATWTLRTDARRARWGAFGALLLLLTLLLGACAEPPNDLMKKAEDALLDATRVSECAEEEYRQAEDMLRQAKALVESGDYDEAAIKADAAYQLAQKAKAKGEANWEECQKAKAALAAGSGEQKGGDRPAKLEAAMLKTIYFPYNESNLSEEARATLQANAELLREFSDAQVTVEGHCDERGSTEYNIALGERRAQSVRKYLMQLGIDGARLGVLSWGEEKPADSSGTDAGFARNRRAEFTLR